MCWGAVNKSQQVAPTAGITVQPRPPWSLGKGSAFLAGPVPRPGPPCRVHPWRPPWCVPLGGTCCSLISRCAASRWGGSGDGGARGSHSGLSWVGHTVRGSVGSCLSDIRLHRQGSGDYPLRRRARGPERCSLPGFQGAACRALSSRPQARY